MTVFKQSPWTKVGTDAPIHLSNLFSELKVNLRQEFGHFEVCNRFPRNVSEVLELVLFYGFIIEI